MAKTIVVVGYGVGISAAVARKFGAEGFAVALVARNATRLAEGVKALEAEGVKAAAFTGDVSSAEESKAVIGKVRETLGPISVLQWTAYGGGAGNLLEADTAGIHGALDVSTIGLLAAVQAALPDLRQERGAVLVTNGGLLFDDPKVDEMAVQWGAAGLAIANAAKHKLVGLLHQQLKPDGVYVGEVIVTGSVKGTSWDNGSATIEAASVAKSFWDLYSSRSDLSAKV
jgi:NAD(P)-dependent dehydrogenase (short-subunit alcohol dehydrogenase family)